jgi:hypothetical protein
VRDPPFNLAPPADSRVFEVWVEQIPRPMQSVRIELSYTFCNHSCIP